MGITKDANRQAPVVAEVDFAFGDLTTTVASNAIEVPQGAVVTGGFIVFDTAFNSETSDVFTVGDSGDADRYKASVDGSAAALTALVPTGYQYTATSNVSITWTGTGTAPTAGAGRLVIEYYVDGRSQHTQG